MTIAKAITELSNIRSLYNCFDVYEEPKYHALTLAIESLKEKKTGAWIPVSDALPKDGQPILATIKDRRYNNPVIIRNYDSELEEKLLIAWMPLPLAYKVGDE